METECYLDKTTLPLGVVNAVPASQIAAMTAPHSGYRLARKRNGDTVLQIAVNEPDQLSQFSYKVVWRDIPTVDVDD